MVQLDVNSRVQHPDALFLHPVALFVSCYAPCPFCLTVPFINVGLRLEQPILHQHGPYLNTVLREKCHGQSVLHGYVELSLLEKAEEGKIVFNGTVKQILIIRIIA